MNIAQQIVNGLVLGSGYACIALGWTILLGVARLVNFRTWSAIHAGCFRDLVCDDPIGTCHTPWPSLLRLSRLRSWEL